MEDATVLDFEFEAHANPVSDVDRAAMLANPGFGKIFTDHMVVIRYHSDKGWHGARIEPRRPLQIDPACAVLHYAQEIFEGLKAYRRADGGTALFRPEANARRFNESAERLAMCALELAPPLERHRVLIDSASEQHRDRLCTLAVAHARRLSGAGRLLGAGSGRRRRLARTRPGRAARRPAWC